MIQRQDLQTGRVSLRSQWEVLYFFIYNAGLHPSWPHQVKLNTVPKPPGFKVCRLFPPQIELSN